MCIFVHRFPFPQGTPEKAFYLQFRHPELVEGSVPSAPRSATPTIAFSFLSCTWERTRPRSFAALVRKQKNARHPERARRKLPLAQNVDPSESKDLAHLTAEHPLRDELPPGKATPAASPDREKDACPEWH